jgi:hypothetical protein
MDAQQYYDSIVSDPTQAMVPLAVAQALLKLSRSAVIDRTKGGTLTGVKVEIDGSVYRGITLSSLQAQIDQQKKPLGDAAAMKVIENIVIDHVKSAPPKDLEALTVTYHKVMAPLGLSTHNPQHRAIIGRLLGRLSEASAADKSRGFMLSAVVVRKATNRPNPSFWELAEEIELYDSKTDDDQVFWRTQLKAIRKHYA